MIVTGTLHATGPTMDMAVFPNSSGHAMRREIIVADPERSGAPEAFMVSQGPDSVGGAHCHDRNQFQVFVEGRGALGKHAVRPFTVHYAGMYTGYGPLFAGSEGMSFLTLRYTRPGKIIWLPEERERVKPVPRRHLTSEPCAAADSEAARASREREVVDVVIPQTEDGIAAWMVRLPPNTSVPAPRVPAAGGQYRVVAAGSMKVSGAELPYLGCGYFSPEETAASIASGDTGLDVLVLQFPKEPALDLH